MRAVSARTIVLFFATRANLLFGQLGKSRIHLLDRDRVCRAYCTRNTVRYKADYKLRATFNQIFNSVSAMIIETITACTVYESFFGFKMYKCNLYIIKKLQVAPCSQLDRSKKASVVIFAAHDMKNKKIYLKKLADF